MGLLPTGFGRLDVAVLGLESLAPLLTFQDVFCEGPLALLVSQPCCEVFSWTFNNGSNLRILRDIAFLAILLVMSLRIENRSHAK